MCPKFSTRAECCSRTECRHTNEILMRSYNFDSFTCIWLTFWCLRWNRSCVTNPLAVGDLDEEVEHHSTWACCHLCITSKDIIIAWGAVDSDLRDLVVNFRFFFFLFHVLRSSDVFHAVQAYSLLYNKLWTQGEQKCQPIIWTS